MAFMANMTGDNGCQDYQRKHNQFCAVGILWERVWWTKSVTQKTALVGQLVV